MGNDNDNKTQQIFTQIYERNGWGNTESLSGPSSTLQRTENLRGFLSKFFSLHNIKSVVDAPCGDMNWMSKLLESCNVHYTGIDIVEDLIENNKKKYGNSNTAFFCKNILQDPLPKADLMICRDFMFHMSYSDISRFMKNFIESGIKYIFLTTHINSFILEKDKRYLYNRFHNRDIKTGGWRMFDLFLPPFNFPTPICSCVDGGGDRYLALFSREQLVDNFYSDSFLESCKSYEHRYDSCEIEEYIDNVKPITNRKEDDKPTELLFFTYADKKYHEFAAIYPFFVLLSNPDAKVEICISDYELFSKQYQNIIEFYQHTYPGKILYRSVEVKNVLANTVRFLVQPVTQTKYVYIGDVDILILDDDILEYWLEFMKRHKCDFGNVMRYEGRLTGLHFIEFEKMYPVKSAFKNDVKRMNDEMFLFSLMEEKGLKFPMDAVLQERKTHGLHVSVSRPPLATLTTHDDVVPFPSWGPGSSMQQYLDIRYCKPMTEFMKIINERQVSLRKLIQIIDMTALYITKQTYDSVKERNYWKNLFIKKINESKWCLLKVPFSFTKKYDVEYNYLYALYCILGSNKITSILEFNLEKSTKITIQYANHYHVKHIIFDYDRHRVEHFIKKWNIKLTHSIVYVGYAVKNNDEVVYQHFNECTKGHRYSLILLKSPVGGGIHVDILSRIPEILCSEFAILFDHLDVPLGETILEKVKDKLIRNGISFEERRFSISGRIVCLLFASSWSSFIRF